MTLAISGTPPQVGQAIEAAVEDAIRELVRRDGVNSRRTPDTDSELAPITSCHCWDTSLARTVKDIDRLISKPETLRTRALAHLPPRPLRLPSAPDPLTSYTRAPTPRARPSTRVIKE